MGKWRGDGIIFLPCPKVDFLFFCACQSAHNNSLNKAQLICFTLFYRESISNAWQRMLWLSVFFYKILVWNFNFFPVDTFPFWWERWIKLLAFAPNPCCWLVLAGLFICVPVMRFCINSPKIKKNKKIKTP